MAQRGDDVQQSLQSFNSKKVYVAQQASVAASGSLRLDNVVFRASTVLAAGPTSPGPLLFLQGSQDFRYRFTNGAGTATSDDIFVRGGSQEPVYPEAGDTHLNVIRDSADGVVRVYRAV